MKSALLGLSRGFTVTVRPCDDSPCQLAIWCCIVASAPKQLRCTVGSAKAGRETVGMGLEMAKATATCVGRGPQPKSGCKALHRRNQDRGCPKQSGSCKDRPPCICLSHGSRRGTPSSQSTVHTLGRSPITGIERFRIAAPWSGHCRGITGPNRCHQARFQPCCCFPYRWR
jgi:hypothetical protein